MKNMKLIISVVLALVVVLSFATFTLAAEEHVCQFEKVWEELDENQKPYTKYACECGEYYVEHDGYRCTSTVMSVETCTKNGYVVHYCPVCDDHYLEVVAAHGHGTYKLVFNSWPTCTEDGDWDVFCETCGVQIDDAEWQSWNTYNGWQKLGHDYEAVVTEPTCTEEGFTTHTCTRCQDTYKDTIVAALGHDYEAVVTEPTCTEEGFTTHTCTRCQDTYKDTFVEALGHDMGEFVVTTAPTCTEEGEERSDCSRCDHFETRKVDALGHDYEAVVTAPTCTEEGFTTHTCTRCQDTYKDTFVEALGHDMGEFVVTTAPTCTEEGEERSDCSRCDHFETRKVDALGHDMGEFVETTAPTCTEEGEERSDCSRCDHFETRKVDALGHDYEAVLTAPTCTEAGFTTYTCTRCGHSYVDDQTDASGHVVEIIPGKAATCTEPGLTEGKKCATCGEVLVAQEEIPALGHDFVDGVCTRCGEEDNGPPATTDMTSLVYVGIIMVMTVCGFVLVTTKKARF